MTTTDKIAKVNELRNELKSVQTSLKPDLYLEIIDGFRNRGFVTDPRGENYNRCLYNPELKMTVVIGNISNVAVSISVYDMVNDGMNFGTAYQKLNNGSVVRFEYLKLDFEKFYNTTFKNRVKKLEDILKTK